ncbi:LOW QUALITY PROTEIN: serpin B9-like [Mus pahari]|uniref:LOW QUALITY PROTEIN: serpin B9-like n=1 Tax=Mus pahari TaxID=10093 RepID=UPI000A305F85|nr:LOW QUALITY PROTEIN: serpin B9-like [Mus pahari]
MNTLSQANGTFAFHLLKMLCQDNPSENVCFSPMSISSALAMVLLGAKGDTAVQICQALHLNPDEDIHQGFQLLLHNLNEQNKNKKYCLRMANKLFAESTCELLPTFKESCLKFYHSEMEQLSFAEAAEKSRQHINMWVSKQTKGKIPDLLSKDSVDSETRLILANALYFQGTWYKPFENDSTKEMPFKINKKETRPVQMMWQEDRFCHAYVKEIQAQVLVIPYEGIDMSFVVLLPDEGVDISKVENNLNFEKLTAWTKPNFLNGKQLHVYLLKFQLQEDYDMNSLLQHLGILDVFHGNKADLSGMSTKKDLCLSKFVHKCVVEVNEVGTEAAAASAGKDVVMCLNSSPKNPPTFCADHPFVFFIMHNKTKSILFCGRFSSP